MEALDTAALTFLFGLLVLMLWEPACAIIDRCRRAKR